MMRGYIDRMLRPGDLPAKDERKELCRGKSASELKQLLDEGKVSTNDVRHEFNLPPVEHGG